MAKDKTIAAATGMLEIVNSELKVVLENNGEHISKDDIIKLEFAKNSILEVYETLKTKEENCKHLTIDGESALIKNEYGGDECTICGNCFYKHYNTNDSHTKKRFKTEKIVLTRDNTEEVYEKLSKFVDGKKFILQCGSISNKETKNPKGQFTLFKELDGLVDLYIENFYKSDPNTKELLGLNINGHSGQRLFENNSIALYKNEFYVISKYDHIFENAWEVMKFKTVLEKE